MSGEDAGSDALGVPESPVTPVAGRPAESSGGGSAVGAGSGSGESGASGSETDDQVGDADHPGSDVRDTRDGGAGHDVRDDRDRQDGARSSPGGQDDQFGHDHPLGHHNHPDHDELPGHDEPPAPPSGPSESDGHHSALVATLSEPVRARVLDFAAQVAGGLSHAALPVSLRPFARFTPAKRARLAATPLAAALEADAVFRGRVAERVRETYPEVADTLFAGTIPPAADPRDVAAIAYVLRPEGWTQLLEQAELAAREAERALADEHLGDEVARLKAEIDALREQAKAEIDQVKAELAAERREGDSLRRRIRQLEADMRRAQAQAREAVAEGGVVQNAAAVQIAAAEAELRRMRARLSEAETTLEATRRAGKVSRSADEMRLRLLLDTISEAAAGLQRELAIAPTSARPADMVEAVRADAIGAHDVEGQARAGDDPALLDAMLALPRAHLIIDGYNVTKTGFPTLSLHEQRIRLLKGLGGLAARTGAEITCVFDGAELAGPVPVPPHKGVRVLFSRGGEIADALIRRLVAAEPPGRPLIVVSSDKEVAEGVRRSGARPVPSSMLVRRLGRS